MNFLDKNQKYIIEFDEEHQRWVCTSEDLQREGAFEIGNLQLMDQDLAPALAVIDCAGYDAAIIGEMLGLWK